MEKEKGVFLRGPFSFAPAQLTREASPHPPPSLPPLPCGARAPEWPTHRPPLPLRGPACQGTLPPNCARHQRLSPRIWLLCRPVALIAVLEPAQPVNATAIAMSPPTQSHHLAQATPCCTGPHATATAPLRRRDAADKLLTTKMSAARLAAPSGITTYQCID
jgi:hypothetical protein